MDDMEDMDDIELEEEDMEPPGEDGGGIMMVGCWTLAGWLLMGTNPLLM